MKIKKTIKSLNTLLGQSKRSDQAGKAAMGLWPPLEVVRTTWQRT